MTAGATVTGLGLVGPAPSGALDLLPRLGAKALRFITRPTGLSLVACDAALGPDRQARPEGEGFGIVVGAEHDLTGVYDFGRESFLNARPQMVSAALVPNCILNRAAAEAAIRYGARGVNATVAGGRTCGLAALSYTLTALSAGYVETVLVAAAQGAQPPTSAAVIAAGRAGRAAPLAEAAAALLVETPAAALAAGREPIARIDEVFLESGGPLDCADYVSEVLRRVLSAAGPSGRAPSAISWHDTGDRAVDDAVEQGIAAAFPDAAPQRIKQPADDCYAATSALQLAEAVELIRTRGVSGPVLVMCADRDAGFAAAVVAPCPELRGGDAR